MKRHELDCTAVDPYRREVLTSLFAGLGLGFSLIVAIGAQNLFVLRQGLRREHVVAVALVCALSDTTLIAIGVSGVGLILAAIPWLIDAVRWAGALFLLGYGLMAARRAWRPSGAALTEDAGGAESASDAGGAESASGRGGLGGVGPSGENASASAAASEAGSVSVLAPSRPRLAAVLLTCVALTWLNPHVYLDTVFLLGSIANTHGDARWAFAAGAAAASVVWFFGLALGARYLGRWLATPRAWRVLDAIIAVVMIALAVSLVVPH